jgi:hypothetical protein
MATNLNVSVTGHGLVERSKQQQRDARTGRLTREAITRDAETNREEILRATASQPALSRALAPSRPIDTETAPYLRSNRPAASRLPDDAFLVVTNFNHAFVDNLNRRRVRVEDTAGNVTMLRGLLDFSMQNFRNRTYLFLPQNKTLDDFESSIPYRDIYTLLDTRHTPKSDDIPPLPDYNPENVPGIVHFIKPTLRLKPFRPNDRNRYTVSLVSDFSSSTGNSGGIMAGYFGRRTFYYAAWFTLEYTNTPIQVDNVRWGYTNPATIELYPPGYPR